MGGPEECLGSRTATGFHFHSCDIVNTFGVLCPRLCPFSSLKSGMAVWDDSKHHIKNGRWLSCPVMSEFSSSKRMNLRGVGCCSTTTEIRHARCLVKPLVLSTDPPALGTAPPLGP